MGIYEDVVKKIKASAAAKAAGDKQTEGLGGELAGKARMMEEGRKALAGNPAPVAPAPTAPAPKRDTGRRYGSEAGEKRMDVREALKPLGSFVKGTTHVPKTGVYKLHEGEAVIPKDKNTMDAKTAMEGIVGKKSAKPEKKIHEIRTKKTDDGKFVHTHLHHHPSHHADETHVSNNIGEAQDHLKTMEPQMSAQPPAMPEAGVTPEGAMPTAGM